MIIQMKTIFLSSIELIDHLILYVCIVYIKIKYIIEIQTAPITILEKIIIIIL